MQQPQFTTWDLGIAIRDFLEETTFRHFEGTGTGEEPSETEHVAEITHVDVSCAHNPVVHLDNGQSFVIRVIARPDR